jgi:hypothetical protein
MCSSAASPSGSRTRWAGSRGRLHRIPEGVSRDPARSVLPGAGSVTVLVLQVEAVRGGAVPGVVFHTDQGSEYTARAFRQACERPSVRQSMGRPGSALDNAVIESWHSTLEFELRSLHAFATRAQAHGPRSRPGSRTTTTPGGTPPSACAAPWITNSPCRERTPRERGGPAARAGQRRRLRRCWPCCARQGYGAPPASRVLRIAPTGDGPAGRP